MQSFSPYQRYIKLLSQCEYTHITEILLRFNRNDRCLCRKVKVVWKNGGKHTFSRLGFHLSQNYKLYYIIEIKKKTGEGAYIFISIDGFIYIIINPNSFKFCLGCINFFKEQ